MPLFCVKLAENAQVGCFAYLQIGCEVSLSIVMESLFVDDG